MNLAIAMILMFSQAAPAQQSVAPTGATGICKDGTYSTAAVKDGACRGHKGVQTWYNTSLPARPAPTPGSMPSRQAPTAAASPTLPAPTPVRPAALPAPASAATMPSRPAPATLPAPASRPAPAQSTAMPSMPAPTAKSGIAGERASLASKPQAAGGGPGLVWVNTASKVYHCQGSDFYGKTKAGAYMSEADAKAQGAHANRNKPCS